MDGNFSIDLEAQSYSPAINFEHRDLEHRLDAIGADDDHGFLASPRQDQHGDTSIVMMGCLVHS